MQQVRSQSGQLWRSQELAPYTPNLKERHKHSTAIMCVCLVPLAPPAPQHHHAPLPHLSITWWAAHHHQRITAQRGWGQV